MYSMFCNNKVNAIYELMTWVGGSWVGRSWVGLLIIRKFPYPLGQYLTRSPPGYTRCPLKSIILPPDDHFFIFGLDEPKNQKQRNRTNPYLQVWQTRPIPTFLSPRIGYLSTRGKIMIRDSFREVFYKYVRPGRGSDLGWHFHYGSNKRKHVQATRKPTNPITWCSYHFTANRSA